MKERRALTDDNIDDFGFLFSPDSFSRKDDREDMLFYQKARLVSHLDSVALGTVEKVVGGLIVEKKPVILDLMVSWNSHIMQDLETSRVVGLGLNKTELERNRVLTERVIHDLNEDPVLHFPANTFDVVLNTVSVDYMTHPVEVFREVGRVLKPGGLFLVIFSNRFFPEKVVKAWAEASEEERIILVEEFFTLAERFEDTTLFVSKGRPRPADDKYAHLDIPSDPIYAVYAEKRGGDPDRKRRPKVILPFGEKPDPREVEKNKTKVKETLACPYCGERMKKWIVPDNPFCQTWDNDYMYICFNDRCSYYVRGWDQLSAEGNRGMSYRLMYNPEKDRCMPIPVPSNKALREGIAEES
ncbi:MAG: class I SAM-dependent methyltransferase [Desulfatiglandaceae bacterium]